MVTTQPSQIVLEIPPDPALIRAVLALPEAAGGIFGLDRRDILRLTLAVEECFLALCRVADPGQPLRLALSSRGSGVRAEFRFHAASVDPRPLNFAATAPAAEGQDRELGLYLAARTTDRCRLERPAPDTLILFAEVDRSYPEVEPLRDPLAVTGTLALTGTPAAETLTHAALLAAGLYPARLCPAEFRTPARLADMVRAGQYRPILASDQAGRPVGLMLWRESAGRAALFSGPYVLTRERREEIAEILTGRLLEQLGRTPLLSVVSERPTPDAPAEYFEVLGSLCLSGPDGRREQPALFRALREDLGAVVWSPAETEPFLRRAYAAMACARDILPAPARGREVAPHSLLATSADIRRGLAVLRPLMDGWDLPENLAAHVKALAGLGIPDILFHLDLGQGWQAGLIQELAQAGFAPRLVMPHAATSDLLVLEHAAGPC